MQAAEQRCHIDCRAEMPARCRPVAFFFSFFFFLVGGGFWRLKCRATCQGDLLTASACMFTNRSAAQTSCPAGTCCACAWEQSAAHQGEPWWRGRRRAGRAARGERLAHGRVGGRCRPGARARRGRRPWLPRGAVRLPQGAPPCFDRHSRSLCAQALGPCARGTGSQRCLGCVHGCVRLLRHFNTPSRWQCASGHAGLLQRARALLVGC